MAIDSDTVVLTIARDNRALHVGGAGNTAAHVIAVGTRAVDVSYYDPGGQLLRLVKVHDGRWGFAVNETVPPVSERVLLNRIDTALVNMQTILDGQLDSQLAPVSAAAGPVPRPTGPLPAVLSALAAAFGDLEPFNNQGNWLHQLAHAAGLAH